jgi:hypothetical protein
MAEEGETGLRRGLLKRKPTESDIQPAFAMKKGA